MKTSYFTFGAFYRSFSLLLLVVGISAHAGPTNQLAPTNQAAAAPATPPDAAFDLLAFEHDRIIAKANAALAQDPVTITKYHAPYGQGGVNDFYSMGDSWFPDPA